MSADHDPRTMSLGQHMADGSSRGEPALVAAPTTVARRRVPIMRQIRNSGLPIVAVIILAILVVGSIVVPWLTSHDAFTQNLSNRLQSPSSEHWLGTDTLGRDVLTRLAMGGRTTLRVVVLSLALGGAVGLALGIISGYRGGVLDSVISRVTEATLAFPTILFGLLFAVTLGASYTSVVLAIGLNVWSRFVLVIRSEVLSLKEREFVLQAKVNGCSGFRIGVRHLFPNVLNTFVVLASVNLGVVILSESTLSFLGAGIPPPNPSWGQMISEGRQYMGTAWWLSLFPGLAITIAVLSFFLFGDWLRDKLDPHLRQVDREEMKRATSIA